MFLRQVKIDSIDCLPFAPHQHLSPHFTQFCRQNSGVATCISNNAFDLFCRYLCPTSYLLLPPRQIVCQIHRQQTPLSSIGANAFHNLFNNSARLFCAFSLRKESYQTILRHPLISSIIWWCRNGFHTMMACGF